MSVLTSIPAMNIRKTAPTDPKNNMEGVNSIISRPKGPIMIPATNNAKTYGRCSLLKTSEKKDPKPIKLKKQQSYSSN